MMHQYLQPSTFNTYMKSICAEFQEYSIQVNYEGNFKGKGGLENIVKQKLDLIRKEVGSSYVGGDRTQHKPDGESIIYSDFKNSKEDILAHHQSSRKMHVCLCNLSGISRIKRTY